MRGHDQDAPIPEQVERLLWLTDDQPDDGVIRQIGDGEPADADAVAREIGGQLGEHTGAVLEEDRELRLQPHHHTSTRDPVAVASWLCKVRRRGVPALLRARRTATGDSFFSRPPAT